MDAGLDRWRDLLTDAAEAIWPLRCTTIVPGDAVQVASSSVRVRVSRLLRACAVLVGAGYVSESSGQVRSIWEDAATVAFMAESPAARATKWIDFAELRRVHHLKRGIADPGTLTAEELALLEAAVADMESCTGSDWAGTSASGLAHGLASSKDANAAALGRDFGIYYQTLCDDAHGSPFAVDQLLSKDGDAARVDVGPSSDRLDELPALAIYGALQVGLATQRMGADVDVERLYSALNEAQGLRASSF